MRQGYIIIGFCIVLLVAAGIIVKASLSEEQALNYSEIIPMPGTNTLPIEEGVFKLSNNAEEFLDLVNRGVSSNQTLTSYYNRRAYPGAPPTIPHPTEEAHSMGGKDCLQCHQNGGYVDKYKAFAPVSPHTDYINCKQCHVPVKSTGLFKANNWYKMEAPEAKQQALLGSPPIIPHSLEMRNNCLSCHGGPSAPKEIRVTHPNRVNCRQCHALNDNAKNTTKIWTR
ncbi:MAG: nitrate reductase cytochrome c-type subunit [Cyclobacteriaceae bacterium]|nr:nitrate reductase cytochrome c-type subunit [Cyclobacteriaceae bacterium]